MSGRGARFLDEFRTCANERQALTLMARAADEMEGHFERMLKHAGLDKGWLPQEVRRQSTPRFSPVTWLQKLEACNGRGDYNTFAGEIAGGFASILDKQEEMEAKLSPPPPPEEPRLTRAEWDALDKQPADAVTDASYKRGPGRPRSAA